VPFLGLGKIDPTARQGMSDTYKASLPLVLEDGDSVTRVDKDAVVQPTIEDTGINTYLEDKLEYAERLLEGVNTVSSRRTVREEDVKGRPEIPLEIVLTWCKEFRIVRITANDSAGPLNEALQKIVSAEVREQFVILNERFRIKADAMDGLGLSSSAQQVSEGSATEVVATEVVVTEAVITAENPAQDATAATDETTSQDTTIPAETAQDITVTDEATQSTTIPPTIA